MRVAGYLVRRVATGAFTLVAMVTVTFLIYWALPNQPGRFVYPEGPKETAFQLRDGAHRLGADRPKLTQYGDWWWHVLHGDFGHEWSNATLNDNVLTTQPIGPSLFPAVRETLSLLIGGAVLVVLLALPLGALAGRRVGARADRVISLLALVGVCLHPIVVGRLFKLAVGEHSTLLGYCTFVRHPQAVPGFATCGGPVDWFTHLLLPWATFAVLFLALYTRMTRASVAETIDEDYVRTARAKGASEFRVLGRHVVPNAALRVLTMVGMDIGTAIGVAVFVEWSFGLSGLGGLSVYAMVGNQQVGVIDLPLLLAVVAVITLIVVIGNLVVDLFYAVVDPRTSAGDRPGRTKQIAAGVM